MPLLPREGWHITACHHLGPSALELHSAPFLFDRRSPTVIKQSPALWRSLSRPHTIIRVTNLLQSNWFRSRAILVVGWGFWVPFLRQTCLKLPTSAICVQSFDDSLSPAIHTTYRISLRSSSLREPRYPLLRVVFRLFKNEETFLRPSRLTFFVFSDFVFLKVFII